MRTRVFRFGAIVLALALTTAFPLWAGGGQEEAEEGAAQQGTEQSEGSQDSGQSSGSTESTAIKPGEPVATVNGVPLSSQDFEEQLTRYRQQMQQQGRGNLSETQLNDMRSNILEGMINEELLYQTAMDSDISIGEEQVEQRISQYKAQYGESGFARALENAGISEDQLREDISRSLAIQQLIEQEVNTGIAVSEAEQREFYDENTERFSTPESVSASHILISTQDLESDTEIQQAKERAQELLSQIEDGADFAELAREHSEGPSASRGGNLGEFSRGQMVPAFEEAAFALEAGEVSDIVETQFGFHIIKVSEKSEAGTQAFEDVKSQIAQFLRQQKQQQAIQDYLDELKDNADIERNVSFG